MPSTPSDHEKDHQALAAAITPSRRSWMLQNHLDRHHAEYDVRVLPSEARAASLDSIHHGLHDFAEAPPAHRVAVCKAIAEDLHGALDWLRGVDAESAEQIAVVEAFALIAGLGDDPRTADGDGLVRAWKALTS